MIMHIIYYKSPKSKGKKVVFDDIEALKLKTATTAISEEDVAAIIKANQRGHDIFAIHNPYMSEMSSGEVSHLMIDWSADRLIHRFYQLMEEI